MITPQGNSGDYFAQQDRIAWSPFANTGTPDPLTNIGAHVLSGAGQARYRQFELTAKLRLSDKSQVNPKYRVRFSVSAYNLTDHFNPEAFHNNVADAAYVLFFGQRGRHFTADFDVIF